MQYTAEDAMTGHNACFPGARPDDLRLWVKWICKPQLSASFAKEYLGVLTALLATAKDRVAQLAPPLPLPM